MNDTMLHLSSVIWAALASLGFVASLIYIRRTRAATQALLQRLQEQTRAQELVAREQAAAQERERIYGNLHDDLGAKLLQLIYASPNREQADLARSVLQDLRDVVTRSRGAPCTLLEALGEIRSEAEQRLRSVSIVLNWKQPLDLPDPALDQAQSLHLFRIVREAISNVIRHAQAHTLIINMISDGRILRFEFVDDGIGPGSSGSGRGKENMRERARALDGDITWKGGTAGGTKVLLGFPLPQTSSSL